jgi:hypothetical protein
MESRFIALMGKGVRVKAAVKVGLVAVTAIVTDASASWSRGDFASAGKGRVVEGTTEGHVVAKCPIALRLFVLQDANITASALNPPEVGRSVTGEGSRLNEEELETDDAVGGKGVGSEGIAGARRRVDVLASGGTLSVEVSACATGNGKG